MSRNIEILKIEDNALVDFQNQCKISKGKVNIIVHPFYSENTQKTKNGRYVTKKYLSIRDKYIRECLESNIPTIFFQQNEDYNLLLSKLESFGEYTVYTVKTKRGEETPIGGREAWDKLANILSNSNVKLVNISGLYLVNLTREKALKEFNLKYDKERIQLEYIDNLPSYKKKFKHAKTFLDKELVPTGCVGYLIMNLLRYGFDISISELTAPD